MTPEHTKSIIRKAGGPAKVSREAGITSSAVSQWAVIPAERVGLISHLTGLPPHEIRPDLFPVSVEQRH